MARLSKAEIAAALDLIEEIEGDSEAVEAVQPDWASIDAADDAYYAAWRAERRGGFVPRLDAAL